MIRGDMKIESTEIKECYDSVDCAGCGKRCPPFQYLVWAKIKDAYVLVCSFDCGMKWRESRQVKTPVSKDIPCPTCGAKIGENCVSKNGKPYHDHYIHASRRQKS